MKKWLALVAAVVVIGSLVGAASAQTQAPAPATPKPAAPAAPASPASPAGMEKSIEGKIKSVDPAGKMLTLQDGTQFMIPSGVKLTKTELTPGANVKVAYEEKNGEKVIKHLEVQK